MGMGEPLLNFEPVMDAADVLMDDFAFGLSKRRVTVSTAGVVPRIYALPNNARTFRWPSRCTPRTMSCATASCPSIANIPSPELLAACRHHLASVGDRRSVTFEYTLIDGVNDSLDDARRLAKLLKGVRCKINLIPFNPFPDDTHGYRRPSPADVSAFQRILQNAGLVAMLRATRGDQIDAACGQLTGQVRDRTRRRDRYLAAREVAA